MIRLRLQFYLPLAFLLLAIRANAQLDGGGPSYSVGMSCPVGRLYLFGPPNTCYAVQSSSDSINWFTAAILNPTVWPAQMSLSVTQDMVFFRSAVLSTWSVGGFSEALDLRRDFGAIGDGVADDTTAVQAMFNSTQVHSNAVVFVPPGTYQLTQTCKLGQDPDAIQPRLVLLGLDASRTIFKWTGPSQQPVFEFVGCSPEFGGINIQTANSQTPMVVHTAAQ